MKKYARMSQLYAPTLKEDPAEAELASHRLLLRAGMIRKSASGLYSYLPLAWRSLRKIEQIIREEMDEIGAQEMQVPILTDGEFWRQSGRWNAYGPELMRISDRHDREFALGPTHEEAFTALVRGELRSYKQLPLTLYQMQDKFRDERRPRFGLMRSREFIMKDAYSFDADHEGMVKSYNDEKGAYEKICKRCGLWCLPVVADSGEIGGDMSVEFMAIADAGEAELVYCDCGFAADTEAATAPIALVEGEEGDLEKVLTPDCGTIADLAEFLHVPEAGTRKALALVDGDGKPWVCFVPGDHEMNDVKAAHEFGDFHMMTDEELVQHGLVKGFMGPIGLPEGVGVCADVSIKDSQWWAIGANEKNYHYVHAKQGRDFTIGRWVDVISAKAGDLCPKCGRPLKGARGIEVGQVFAFGDKYSTPMGATFTDEDGNEKPFLMGSYGIGVSRLLAASVEQHHDEHGIIWPVSIAPYEVEVVPLDVNDELVWPVAEKVAGELIAKGVEVLVDDRKERPGVKFNDADLMGLPYQVVCGKKAVKNGNVELKNRATGERSEVAIDQVAELLASRVIAERG
ncbi:MAG: proline--tRNA ligase [Tractidigestivibacter sp.]|jgi:prolyl-tRNA synthetase|uniref:proline--tRNA ligase n=1 Tax=Tractidigestivibacter sp. TaxID=2847320 RepID=UPI003D94342A